METQETPSQANNINILSLQEMNQQELLNTLKQLIETQPINNIRDTVDSIKQVFYKKQQQLQSTCETNEDNVPIEISKDQILEFDTKFKELITIYREKRAEYNAAKEAEYQNNYTLKQNLIKKLEELISCNGDLSETINTFRTLQNEWKSIGAVPQSVDSEIWKEYNYYQEQFYDLIKINTALREYDFKKNLELKNDIILQAEKLQTEEDVVKAFQLLQKLHNDWREIGPVEREIREEIWNKFKNLSTEINKRHQTYFENLKEQEIKLTKEKEEICLAIENINFDELKTYKNWEEKVAEVISYNDSFKSTNPLERRVNIKIYKRFRTACDKFFEAKNNYYKEVKEVLVQNLDKKRKLVEQAEQLKSSREWKATTEKLIALQKEWKEIGPTQKKNSDIVWNKFVAACDYFFEQKELNFKQKKTEEQDNLKLKLEAIENIKSYQLTGNDEEDYSALRNLSDQFLAIGHIPYKEKDNIYNAYKNATNELFGQLRTKRRTAQLAFTGDRNKLIRQYENLKQQIATYENNIGFFNKNQKNNSMLKDLEHKINNLKQDLAIIVEQINTTENK